MGAKDDRARRTKVNRMPGIRILHEDLDVIVVEKAAGVLSQELRHGETPSVESEFKVPDSGFKVLGSRLGETGLET